MTQLARTLPRRRGCRNRRSRGAPQTAIAVLLVCSLGLVPGCWGKRELEERSFVTLLGIDLADDGRLLVSAVISLPRAAAGSGNMGSGGSSVSSLLLSGAGKDIEEALRQMELLSSREFSTVYLAFVIMGEDFARKDIGPAIDVFSRHLHYKPSTLAAVCQGRAYDFLRDLKPQEEVQPSEHLLKLVSTAHTGLGACPIVTMHQMKVGFMTIGTDPWAPYIGLVSSDPAEGGIGRRDASAGDGQGREGIGETQKRRTIGRLLGSAVFGKVGSVQKMIGTLDEWESMAALIMRNELEKTVIDVAYPGDHGEASLVLHHVQSSLDLELDGGTPVVNYRVVATASVSEVASGGLLPETTQEFRQGLVRTVQEQLLSVLRKTFARLTELGSDVVELGEHAQSHFATYGEWEEYGWDTRFKQAVALFAVKVHILTYGFTLERPYPR